MAQHIFDNLPPKQKRDPNLAHAPIRNISNLTADDKRLAVENALRYFPARWHEELAREFFEELEAYGRIYMYRFKPSKTKRALPIGEYDSKIPEAAAIMLMIDNNLDPKVAKYPEELITYGGNGAVFQNWMQYHLTMNYLRTMNRDQTLVLYSGHPMGLFPSSPHAPRVVVTNGMMIPNYSSKDDWNKFNAIGVTQYGQMTAGSFMYIGPQGIVHGTTITLLNAGRLNNLGKKDLNGKLFVTSGLGGMSGAQSIAAVISKAVCIIAEVDGDAVNQRLADGYIQKKNVFTDLDALIDQTLKSKEDRAAVTLVYHGNIVALWERLAEREIHVELGSDQTSLHNIDDLGYCPIGYSFQEAQELLMKDKSAFMDAIRQTLIRHVDAVNKLAKQGMYFWDYGNAFLKEAGEAGADVWKDKERGLYKYPSYVEDIMGPWCFDYGFGPFRWVCTSGEVKDLQMTDKIAGDVLESMAENANEDIKNQLNDNIKWIREAEENLPIVGSKSRILYADAIGRIKIAEAFHDAVKTGVLAGPIVLGRDHHDVSGTDSPFRETANIYDGSRFTADMAVHNVIGDAMRGATWVSLHNGGGVGWGEVMNGGFGMVLDGSDASIEKARNMLFWDVNNGIARRSWARNQGAIDTINKAMEQFPNLKVTRVNKVKSKILDGLF